MSNEKFKGKVAVITGSSRGIGKAIAIELAKRGAIIVLNGRNKERLIEVENEIKKIHDQVMTVCCDVSTTEGGKQLIDEAVKRFKQIDILVNNVGISMRGGVASLNPDVYKKVFESNVLGTVYPTIPALPYLRRSKGNLIFISSLAGIRGLPYLSAYSSSKMALRAIAESIRVEEAEHKVHVGLIYVAMTEIEHTKETIGADGNLLPLKSRKNMKVHSLDYVAKKVIKNISNRRFITVLSFMGKLNYFLQARLPFLVERILIKNIKRFESDESK